MKTDSEREMQASHATNALATRDSPSSPEVVVNLMPIAGVGDEIVSIDVKVAVRFAGGSTPTSVTLKMPIVSSNAPTVATTLTGLIASDDKGPVALTARDEPPAPLGYSRRWITDRPVVGTLTIEYRAPISNALAPLGVAAPLELRSEAGAVSGMGCCFLILPESDDEFRLGVSWDLSALSPSAAGVCSFGEGTSFLPAPAKVQRLENTYFMAGHLPAA